MNIEKSLLFALLTLPFCSFAQNVEHKAIEEVILRLFKGMELADSAMVHSTFSKAPTTATVLKDKTGKIQLRQENSIQGFLEAIAKPRKEVLYEEIWDLKVNVDGDFAQAWCNYAFYVDKNFSHCGVDAFHLFREVNGEWKIFHLADTRRKTGCDIPKRIQGKHK